MTTTVILDEYTVFTVREVCRVCDVNAELVIELVDEGVLLPMAGSEPADWRFPGTTLVRVQKALNLQRDLQINFAGAALVLDLLEEVEVLRQQAGMRR